MTFAAKRKSYNDHRMDYLRKQLTKHGNTPEKFWGIVEYWELEPMDAAELSQQVIWGSEIVYSPLNEKPPAYVAVRSGQLEAREPEATLWGAGPFTPEAKAEQRAENQRRREALQRMPMGAPVTVKGSCMVVQPKAAPVFKPPTAPAAIPVRDFNRKPAEIPIKDFTTPVVKPLDKPK